MHSLSSFSFTKPHTIASLFKNTPPPPRTNPKPPVHRINTATPATTRTKANHLQQNQKQQQQKQKQPSVAEIERVIGAGVFRDRDTSNRNSEQNKTLFDSILSNSIGKSEGSVERKLRETGEWIIDRTERASNSAGKNILMAVFLWVLPMWILSFLKIISWNSYNENELTSKGHLGYGLRGLHPLLGKFADVATSTLTCVTWLTYPPCNHWHMPVTSPCTMK